MDDNDSEYSIPDEDKRKFPRVELVTKVRYSVMGENIKIDTKSKDISLGGICILSDKPAEKNIVVDIKFILPNKMIIEAIGRVAWCKQIYYSGEFEIGIEFMKIFGNHLEKLKKYIIE